MKEIKKERDRKGECVRNSKTERERERLSGWVKKR